MALLNALFETNTLKELLQICNDVYTKEAVEALSDLFSGTNPSLREVCDAAVEYCQTGESLLDDNVYLFTAPNGKKYVGQTTHLENRMSKYRNNTGSNKHWTSALKKYGFDNLAFEHHSIPTACADIIEKFMILWYELINRNNGYNKTSGGKNGFVMSVETCAKIRMAKLGVPRSDEAISILKATWSSVRRKAYSLKISGENNPMFGMFGENNPMFGKKRMDTSERNRKTIGIKHPSFGKEESCETRAKKSGKNNGMFGQGWRITGGKHPNANTVVVNGKLYSTAKEASAQINKYEKYVSRFISKYLDSCEMFKVSKDFYKYCKDNNIENITREMFETFTQVQHVS
jgi:group I intron endonuclease